MYESNRGFTLVEAMIAVAIMGILAAVAYPSYISYIKKGHRADLKGEMTLIAQRLQSWKTSKGDFANVAITNSAIYGSTAFPRQGTKRYDLVLAISQNNGIATGWTLEATPTRPQDGDGVVCLDHRGRKFWSQGAAACALSDSSSWE